MMAPIGSRKGAKKQKGAKNLALCGTAALENCKPRLA
jgi:hypothetical protein